MSSSQPTLAPAPPSLLDQPGVRESLDRVQAMTRQIYAGEITVAELQDPEIVGERYFRFRVVDAGEMDDFMARYDQWHARLSEVPLDLQHLFRLSADVRQ